MTSAEAVDDTRHLLNRLTIYGERLMVHDVLIGGHAIWAAATCRSFRAYLRQSLRMTV